MTAPDTIKLLARNNAALRQSQDPGDAPRLIPGNPVSTRLEAGIGNCFPGLECDLRNLERRFFPGLEVDIFDQSIAIAGVDLMGMDAAVRNRGLARRSLATLRIIDADLKLGREWRIERITGTFQLYGKRALTLADLMPSDTGQGRQPSDGWTAIRLLVENSPVTLHVRRVGARRGRVLSGRRAPYLDRHGTLAAAFQPGELTQSLCSPWTHDFRDCGCYYWASNHPDIARPPIPDRADAGPDWDRPVPWERAERGTKTPPAKATELDSTSVELDYYEINHRWQELNFVLAGREAIAPYVPSTLSAAPLASRADLLRHLHYVAGVELAVVHEYLAAAFSLQDPAKLNGPLRDNVTAARAELMRIAVGEMRHMRVVNDVLRSLEGGKAFRPALRIAIELPVGSGGKTRPLTIRPADPKAIQFFIDVESPSMSVDGVYSRILATLDKLGKEHEGHAIRTVMAEGEDHYETFLFVQEWLKPHHPSTYLLHPNMTTAPPTLPAYRSLQTKYQLLLNQLYAAYARGFPDGAEDLIMARSTMVMPKGIDSLAEALGKTGYLLSFTIHPKDPRFGVVARPL